MKKLYIESMYADKRAFVKCTNYTTGSGGSVMHSHRCWVGHKLLLEKQHSIRPCHKTAPQRT
jgi:hypothetical protein